MEHTSEYSPPETRDLASSYREPGLLEFRAQALALAVSALGAGPQIASFLDAFLLPLFVYRYIGYSFWVTPFLAGIVAAAACRRNLLINAAGAGIVSVSLFAVILVITLLQLDRDVPIRFGFRILAEFAAMVGCATLGGAVMLPLRSYRRRRAAHRKAVRPARRARPAVVFGVNKESRS